MTVLSIVIVNHSGFAKSYGLYFDLPKVSSAAETVPSDLQAWITFNSIRSGSYDRLKFDDSLIDAYWGTVSGPFRAGTVVQVGGTSPVTTANRDSVDFSGASPSGFGPVTPGRAPSGQFQITTQANFTAKDRYVLGLARPAQTPIARPVAVFPAEPNEIYNITPLPATTIYVIDGSFTAGQIISVSSHSRQPGKIDFSGRSQTTATVTQGSRGTYSVVYS